MADVKISQLPASTTPLDGTEVLPIVQSATTKQVSVANLTAGRAVAASSLTLTTQLAVTSGGTGLNTTAAGTLLSSTALNTISATATPTLGVAGTTAGTLTLSGGTSGTVTLKTALAAGTSTIFQLPASNGTNGYILTTDGTGVTNWTNPTALGIDLDVGTTAITNGASTRVLYNNAGVLGEYSAVPVGVGGTGTSTAFTAGSVVFAGASGVYSQNNGYFFWDNSNARLGLATGTPAYTLDIVNNNLSIPAARIYGNDQDNVRFRFQNVGTGGRTWEIVGGRPGANNSDFSIYDFTGSTSRLILSSTGSLGLGVAPSSWSGPAYELTGGALWSNANSIIYTTQNTYFDGTNFIYKTAQAASYLRQFLGSWAWFISSNTPVQGATANFTQAMSLSTSGFLGIGANAASPAVPLVVGTNYSNYQGNLVNFAGTNVVQPNGVGIVSISSTSATAIDTGGSLAFNSYDTGLAAPYPRAVISGRAEVGVSGNYTGYFAIATTNSAGTIAEKMRVTSAGNVGIGTDNPGTIKLKIATDTAGYALQTVGTVNDYYGMSIYNASAGSSARAYLQLGNNTSQFQTFIACNSSTNSDFGGANALNIVQGGAAPIAFATSNTYRGQFDASGNLLVGTASSGTGKVAIGYTPSSQWGLDFGPTQITLANGANYAFGAGSGIITITETGVNGATAVYIMGGGAVTLVDSTNATYWEAPTTTPAAGKASIAYSGTAYTLYNNQGGSRTFAVAMIRTRPAN